MTVWHHAILQKVAEEVVDLALPDVSWQNVKVLKDLDGIRQDRIDLGDFPGIAIYLGDQSETFDGPYSTNAYEEIGYPVLVTCVDRDRVAGRPSQTANLEKYLGWRQAITMRFVNRPLMEGVCRCTLSSRPVWLGAEWRSRSLWKSPLSFTFWARVSRELFLP